MEKKWSTLHIFSFGDIQVIGAEGKTKKAENLTKLQAVIDEIWENKPQDYVGTKEYHAINIFHEMFCDWQPQIKGENGYRLEFIKINADLIEELVDEVLV